MGYDIGTGAVRKGLAEKIRKKRGECGNLWEKIFSHRIVAWSPGSRSVLLECSALTWSRANQRICGEMWSERQGQDDVGPCAQKGLGFSLSDKWNHKERECDWTWPVLKGLFKLMLERTEIMGWGLGGSGGHSGSRKSQITAAVLCKMVV